MIRSESIGEAEGFNFLDNVVEAMRNLQPKKGGIGKLSSNSSTMLGHVPRVELIRGQSSSINLFEKSGTKQEAPELVDESYDLFNRNKSLYNSSKIFPDTEKEKQTTQENSEFNTKSFLANSKEVQKDREVRNFKSFRDEGSLFKARSSRKRQTVSGDTSRPKSPETGEKRVLAIKSLKKPKENYIDASLSLVRENFPAGNSRASNLFEKLKKKIEEDQIREFSNFERKKNQSGHTNESVGGTESTIVKSEMKARLFRKSKSVSGRSTQLNTAKVEEGHLERSQTEKEGETPEGELESEVCPREGSSRRSNWSPDHFKKQKASIKKEGEFAEADPKKQLSRASPILKNQMVKGISKSFKLKVSSKKKFQILKKTKNTEQKTINRSKSGCQTKRIGLSKSDIGNQGKKSSKPSKTKRGFFQSGHESVKPFGKEGKRGPGCDQTVVLGARLLSNRYVPKLSVTLRKKKRTSSGPNSRTTNRKKLGAHLDSNTEQSSAQNIQSKNNMERKMKMLKYYWKHRNPHELLPGAPAKKGPRLAEQPQGLLLKKGSLKSNSNQRALQPSMEDKSWRLGLRGSFKDKLGPQRARNGNRKLMHSLYQVKQSPTNLKRASDSPSLKGAIPLDFGMKRANVVGNLSKENRHTEPNQFSNTPIQHSSNVDMMCDVSLPPFRPKDPVYVDSETHRPFQSKRDQPKDETNQTQKRTSRKMQFQTISTGVTKATRVGPNPFSKNKEFVINDFHVNECSRDSSFGADHGVLGTLGEPGQPKTDFSKRSGCESN